MEIVGEIKTCKPVNTKDGLIGVVVRHTDVFIFTETTREKGYLLMMNKNVKGKHGAKKSLIDRYGLNNPMGFQYVNLIEFPILGMVAKSLNEDGLFCFHPATKVSFYFSWLDPSAVDYIKVKMMADVVRTLTIEGMMASAIDCVAATSFQRIKIGKKYNTMGIAATKVMDSFSYCTGCSGIMSIGNTNQSASSLVNGAQIGFTQLKERAYYSLVQQTKNSPLNMKPDIECSSQEGPVIKSQFVPQIIRPVVGKKFEVGTTPAEWGTFKNDGSTKGDTVFAWWMRREIVAFASRCSW